MIAIANTNIPDTAMQNLLRYTEVIKVYSKGITYEAVSCHPDVFCCETNDGDFICAPNLSYEIVSSITESGFNIIKGMTDVGNVYPKTASYNAVVTDGFLIHNLKYTDLTIIDRCVDKKHIHVNQAYTRCNLLPLGNNSFITSDKGIHKKLADDGLKVLFVKPEGIILPGFENGFFGGAAGVINDMVFLLGSLKYHIQGQEIKTFLSENGYKVIELYDGPLYDGGSIFFKA